MYLILFVLCFALWIVYTKVLRKLTVGHYAERHVLVTGCDSGFGNLLTKQLDILGFKVFATCLTDSGIESLKTGCSPNVVAVHMDVTNDESIEQAMEVVRKKLPRDKGLWAVVNNAGVLGGIGPTAWQSRKDYEDTMAVNVFGLAMVTKACMPLVVKEKGRVINTASVFGRIAFSTPTYCISKYGVEAFSDVLRRECMTQGTGVSVHIVEPGFYKTPLLNIEAITRRAEVKIKELPQDVRKGLPSNILKRVTEEYEMFINKASPNISEVVDAFKDAIISRFPKKRYLVGTDANIFFRPLWLLPEWLSDSIIVRMLRR